MKNVNLQHTLDNILANILELSWWRFRICISCLFSVIPIPFRYGSVISLHNTYIHLHALSQLLGTNCTRKRRFGDSGSTLISVNVVDIRRAL